MTYKQNLNKYMFSDCHSANNLNSNYQNIWLETIELDNLRKIIYEIHFAWIEEYG